MGHQVGFWGIAAAAGSALAAGAVWMAIAAGTTAAERAPGESASDGRPAAPPAIERVEIGPARELRVNGRPFLPLMAWLQDLRWFPTLRQCGFNATAGYWPGAGGTRDVAEYLERVREAGLYGVMPFDPRIKGHPALLGYIHDDEPDLTDGRGGAPRALPEAVARRYAEIRSADPGRPVFLTLTGNFHPHFGRIRPEERERWYRAYFRAADVVGYDIYPIYGWNRPDWIHLSFDATRLLAELAAPRPVYAWLETSKGGQWTGELERQIDVRPQHIEAQAWMAVIGGATALGWFTHVWKPAYSQFGVPEENRRALRALAARLERLAPAILGPAGPVAEVEVSEGVRMAAATRRAEGAVWLFAVRCDHEGSPARVRFRVEGLAAGTRVEALDEGRTLEAADGGFGDTFDPLAVHLYRWAAVSSSAPPRAN